MQGTVLGAVGNTESEHRKPCPRGAHSLEKEVRQEYTISRSDTNQSGKCRKQDTSAVGVREDHEAASGRKL